MSGHNMCGGWCQMHCRRPVQYADNSELSSDGGQAPCCSLHAGIHNMHAEVHDMHAGIYCMHAGICSLHAGVCNICLLDSRQRSLAAQQICTRMNCVSDALQSSRLNHNWCHSSLHLHPFFLYVNSEPLNDTSLAVFFVTTLIQQCSTAL